MSDFAMPQALSLEDTRRASLPAVRREVIHNTTTQNEYAPGELCYIPVETGAAGAFMDVTCTRLEMTIKVRNPNYYTDFIDLPRCGWNAIIQEFGIELNGALHELNRHYGECIELDMIKRGENKYPYEVCRSNTWRAANGSAGKMHINFIKPSMVTAMGLPHCVMYAPFTGGTTTTSAPDNISQGYLLHGQRFIHEIYGRTLGTAFPGDTQDGTIATPVQTFHASFGQMASSSMELAESYYDDRIKHKKTINAGIYPHPLVNVPVAPPAAGDLTHQGTDLGECTTLTSNRRLLGIPHGGNLLHQYCRVIPSSSYAGYDADLSLLTLAYGQSVNGYSPGQWPAKQPCDLDKLKKEIEYSLKFVSGDAIHNYYANCKNISIGVPINLSADSTGSAAIWGDALHEKPAKNNVALAVQETEFHVSLKVYSSLIGVLAKKWFPELVVPQGRMRVRLRFQEPQILFQTSMDPCRRVPGTKRDFFPYLGVVESKLSTNAAAAINVLRTCDPRRIASGIHPIMVSDYTPGGVYVDAIALGRFPIPQMTLKALHKITKAAFPNMSINSIGSALTSAEGMLMNEFDEAECGNLRGNNAALVASIDASSDSTLVALNRLLYEMERNQEYGFPVLPFKRTAINAAGKGLALDTDPAAVGTIGEKDRIAGVTSGWTEISDYQQFVWPHSYKNYLATPNAVPGVAANRQWLYDEHTGITGIATDPHHDWYHRALNWNPFCNPTPQYVPFANPSDKRATRQITAADYLNEKDTCFGTHLEASQAQTRRSFYSLYPLGVSTEQIETGLTSRLTYVVTDVQLVTQQLILPRNAALSIVENAISGGITMETNAWKEIEMQLPKSDSQKALINMAAAYCTDITFLFRPTETYQGDVAFGHNSFSFYNPFTSFKFRSDTQTVDTNFLGGIPEVYNECVVSGRTAFDIQLQLGSELMPRIPINSINSLIRNIRWGDQVFTDVDYMDLAPRMQPSYQTTNGMVINTLQDGFWACFLPISALDDQTITDNPFFIPLEMSLRSKIRGARARDGALPFLKPLNGSFHLSFNLESYMGQSGRLRTGIPIVNNNMFLKLEKGHLIREYNTQLLTICNCDARVVFERGGTMQFFT